MSVELVKKTMLEAFEQKAAPTNFLSSFFKTSERDIFPTEQCVIDVKRNLEQIAIDVKRGRGGNLNDNKRFTTKEYKPPVYDEYSAYVGDELMKRVPGMDPYNVSQSNLTQLVAMITDDQAQNWAKILRSIEYQASQVLFSGQVPLINDETIDYKQKASHQISVTTAWSDSAGLPYKDIEGGADIIRKDGKTVLTDLVFGSTAWQNFLSNPDNVTKFNLRRVDIANIAPPRINTEGAALHGVVTVGSYTVRCWTYPQFYDIPSDAEIGLASGTIPNGGQSGLPYVPATKVLLIGESIDLRLVYAGLPVVAPQTDPTLAALGITALPMSTRGVRQPYAHVDVKRYSLMTGVRSAPLCVPTQIDGFAWIETEPS